MVNMGELFSFQRLLPMKMDRVTVNQKESSFILEKGDLLFARQSLVFTGAGKCSIFLGNYEPTVFESHIIRCRLDLTQADPLFYFYFFQSPNGRNAISAIVEQGAGAAGVRGSDLARMNVPVPCLKDQTSASSLLDILDRKIELLRASSDHLEAIARTIFKSWFIDFNPVRAKVEGREPEGMDSVTAALFSAEFVESEFGEIPIGWQRKKLVEIADVSWGDTNATKSRYTVDGFVAYSASGPDGLMPTYMFEQTGIVVSAIGANCGATWLASGKWSCIKNTLRLWATASDMSTEFLFYATSGGDLWPKRGSAQPFISQGDARNMKVLVPSNGLAIVFGATVAPIHRKLEAAREQAKTLVGLRDTLLPRLISGTLRVREAEKLVEAAL